MRIYQRDRASCRVAAVHRGSDIWDRDHQHTLVGVATAVGRRASDAGAASAD